MAHVELGALPMPSMAWPLTQTSYALSGSGRSADLCTYPATPWLSFEIRVILTATQIHTFESQPASATA